MSPEDQAVGLPERLHPLFLLTGIGRSLRGLIGAYAGILYLAAQGFLTAALIGAAAILIFSAAALFLHWKRFEYRVGTTEIRIDSGIVSRTHRSIPFDRVQDVDIVQGPVMRVLGLATVKFETGGGTATGAEEGVLQAIALERAQELRELIRAHRSGTPEASPAGEEAVDDRPPVYAIDMKRLLLAGLFNFSLAVFAALVGLTQTAGDLIGFDPFEQEFWQSLLSRWGPLRQFLLDHQVATAFAGLLTLVLVGIATGIVRTTLRDYGFRLDRTEVGLRRRRGLLTRTDVTLPARRAQAAIVSTGPVRDRFGWRELKLQSLARDEGGKGDHVLAPLAHDGEVDAVLLDLGWEEVSRLPEMERVSKVFVWARAIALSPLLLIVGLNLVGFMAAPLWLDEAMRADVAAMILPGVIPLFIIFALLIFAVAARWLDWRRTGYALDGDRLLIRRGWWRRSLLVLPLRRIQSMDLSQSFVARWFGVASLQFGVAGGSMLSTHSIPALPDEKARELRSKLLSGLA